MHENSLTSASPACCLPVRTEILASRAGESLSPYYGRFCGSSLQASSRNYNKINTLRKSNSASEPKPAANSLFWNILRVTPSGSIFCEEYSRPLTSNSNELNILQIREEKNGEGAPILLKVDSCLPRSMQASPRPVAVIPSKQSVSAKETRTAAWRKASRSTERLQSQERKRRSAKTAARRASSGYRQYLGECKHQAAPFPLLAKGARNGAPGPRHPQLNVGYFGLSSTAWALPLALVASQRIWPEALMSTASVRVKPVPEGIRVLRSTNPVAVEIKGTCLPGLNGL